MRYVYEAAGQRKIASERSCHFPIDVTGVAEKTVYRITTRLRLAAGRPIGPEGTRSLSRRDRRVLYGRHPTLSS